MIKAFLEAIHKPIYNRRISVLADMIVSHLKDGDRILDIGCGYGMLGKAVLSHKDCPSGVSYRGLEKSKRGNEAIEVIEHKSGPLPFPDQEFDIVILADVLHHDEAEDFLIGEAARIAKRRLLIKDHKPEGVLGHWRVCFLDWAANDPHGVKCLYRYHTTPEWHTIFEKQGLVPKDEKVSIDIYPPVFNMIFGKKLHYFAALEKKDSAPVVESA
jgi:SAM-dependent methyltransferase